MNPLSSVNFTLWIHKTMTLPFTRTPQYSWVVGYSGFYNCFRSSQINTAAHDLTQLISSVSLWDTSGTPWTTFLVFWLVLIANLRCKLESPGERDQISLWPPLWETIAIDEWCGMSTMGGTIPRQASLCCMSKLAGHTPESRIPLWFLP